MTDQVKHLLEEMEASKVENTYQSRWFYIRSKWEVGEYCCKLDDMNELDIPSVSLLLKWSANEIERCMYFFRKNPNWDKWENYMGKNITWTEIRRQIDEENQSLGDELKRTF